MNRSMVCGILLLGVSGVYAAPSPLSPSLYYEVGGGTSFQRPLSEATVAPDIGISAELNLPLSCDIWDVKDIAIANYPELIVDYLEGQLDQLGQAVVAQLTSIGQGLAVAALQRALPGIYDLSQTLTAQISAQVDIAKRSCEQVVNDVQSGVSILDSWKDIGKSFSWRTSLTGPTSLDQALPDPDPADGTAPAPDTIESATSILDAKRIIAAEGTTAPIPWLGPELAGSAANPIMLVEDLVTAGYKIFLEDSGGEINSDVLDQEETAEGITVPMETISGVQDEQIRLGTLFGDTAAAVEWANRFLGEQEIYTCDDPGCESKFRSGVGLSVMTGDESAELTAAWTAIIAAGDPGIDDLEAVSSQSVQITVSLYEALTRFPLQDQNVYIGRLISDVALSRSVEKALAVRRMILASSDSPVVKGYGQAAKVTEDIVNRIRLEIEDAMWTVETQQKLSSGVSQKVLTYDAIRTSNAPTNVTGGRIDTTTTFVGDRPESP